MSTHFRCPTCGQSQPRSSDPARAPSPCPSCRDQASGAPAWWLDAPLAAFRKAPTPAAPSSPSVRHSWPLYRALVVGGAAGAAIVAACLCAALALPGGRRETDTARLLAQVDLSALTGSLPMEPPSPPAPVPSEPPVPPAPPAPPPATPPVPAVVVAAAAPAPEVQPPAVEPAPRPLVVKRRNDRSEDDLRKEIAKVPELALDRTAARTGSLGLVELAKRAKKQHLADDIGPRVLLARADLAGLPLRMGDECHLGPSAAEHLQGGSLALRAHLGAAVSTPRAVVGDTRPDPRVLHETLTHDGEQHNRWRKPEAIPALQQLLMAENESIRGVLVEQLARIEGKEATLALARRALFDLHPGVRTAALEALARRPATDYIRVILAGFRYPWSPVADHAAEALVALRRTEAVPALLALLDQPEPDRPYQKPGARVWFVREVVRINHLRNCLLCHAASLDTGDRVRGFVPAPNQPLPPPFTRQYYSQNRPGIFVRADVTYLRQDFSVQLNVPNPGPWPAAQRYDFMVRERPATLREAVPPPPGPRPTSEHQRAVFFALRELTGTDPGPTVEDWKRLFLHAGKLTRMATGLRMVRGLAADEQGRVFVADAAHVLRMDVEGQPVPLSCLATGWSGLAVDSKGGLLAAQGQRVVHLDADGGSERVLADGHRGKPFHRPRSLATDRHGGVYFADTPVVPLADRKGSVYYLSAQGTLTRLPIDLSHPTGVALSPDEKTLYVVGQGSPHLLAFALESAGAPGPGKVLCQLDGPGGLDLAVDGRGTLYVANPAVRAVQAFNPQGARLGAIALPDTPLHCATGGKDRATLYVLTRDTLYAVAIDPAPVQTAAD